MMFTFVDDLLRVLDAKTLLIIDRGFYHFQFWSQLIEAHVDFISRLKAGASYKDRWFQIPPVFHEYCCLSSRGQCHQA